MSLSLLQQYISAKGRRGISNRSALIAYFSSLPRAELWAISRSIPVGSYNEAQGEPHGTHDQNGNVIMHGGTLGLTVGHRRPETTDAIGFMGPLVSDW